jgi:hypothetical protein
MNEDAWFLRRGCGWCSSIRPAGIKGWLLLGLFAGAIECAALFMGKHDGRYWPVSLVMILSMGTLFLVAVHRLSVRDDGPRRGCKDC